MGPLHARRRAGDAAAPGGAWRRRGGCVLWFFMVAATPQDGEQKRRLSSPLAGSLDVILDFAESGDISFAREALERQLTLNKDISDEGLANAWGAEVGRTLLATRGDDVACRARARAAAGSDARMSGCALPVAIVCGSGNQGITCAMPVLTYAEDLGIDRERTLRALALADLVAIHTKSYIGALSAFCGVVCAACGAGAAIAWMRGGSREQIGATVVNTLGNVGGIKDGAKASCAAKISAAVDAAILGCDMGWRIAVSARARAWCRTPLRRPSPLWLRGPCWYEGYRR